MTIRGMLRKVEPLDTDKIIEEVMEDSTGEMADLNARQINEGTRADGSVMPDYSFRSVFQYGKQPGPIRLRDTGDWQAGLYAKVQGDKLVFGSTDPKDDILTGKYGVEIEGLSEKYKLEVMRDKIRPGFKQKIEQATGLTMK